MIWCSLSERKQMSCICISQRSRLYIKCYVEKYPNYPTEPVIMNEIKFSQLTRPCGANMGSKWAGRGLGGHEL